MRLIALKELDKTEGTVQLRQRKSTVVNKRDLD
jgi:hypothetical protein